MILIRFLCSDRRLRLGASMLAGLLGGLLGAAALAFIQPAIAEGGKSLRSVSLFALAAAGSVVLNLLSEHLASQQAQDLLLTLRVRLAGQVLATPLERIERIGTSRLLTALTDDATALSMAVPGLIQLCPQLAIVAGCFAYMLLVAPWGCAMVAALLITGLLAYGLPQALAVRAMEAHRTTTDALMQQFRALTEGIKQLQMSRARAEHFMHHELKSLAAEARQHTVRAFGMYLVGTNVGRAFFLVAILGVLVAAPRLNAPPGTAVALALTILFLTRPLEVVLSWLPALGRARVALARIQSCGVELEPAAPRSSHGPVRLAPVVELVGCSYRFRGQGTDSFRVGPIHLRLRPGRLVFVVGGNGSGKTTLAKLVVGLYVPEAGRILVDGHPVTDAVGYREHFSAVFADSFAFDDLPAGLAAAEMTATAYDLASVRAELLGRVPRELSQGQRKRLLLLAALAEDRPIYVFDEWAAEQDPPFRALFYERLLPALRARGKAVLVITHDDQYFGVADDVLRLDCGSLVEGSFRTSRAPSGLKVGAPADGR